MISNIVASEISIKSENNILFSNIKDYDYKCECIQIQQIDDVYKLKLSEKMKFAINALDKDLSSIYSKQISDEYPNYIISSVLVNYCYELQCYNSAHDINNIYFKSIEDIQNSLNKRPLDLIKDKKDNTYYIFVNSDFAIEKLKNALNGLGNLNDASNLKFKLDCMINFYREYT